MPPHKQPTLLRELALRRTAGLVENACEEINQNHDCFMSRHLSYKKTTKLREYLETHIRPLLDEICRYSFTRKLHEPLASAALLSTFMHSHMKTLTFRGDILLFSFEDRNVFYLNEHIANVPNLVRLDLNDVSHIAAETFKILSQNCHKLEVIMFSFEAVTTESFEYIKNIKSLRVLKDTGRIRRCFNVHCNLHCLLLQNLPKLEYINSCSCMGEVLTQLGNVSSLALTHVWDAKPTLKGIETIIRLCPNLKALNIGDFITNVFHRSSDNFLMPITESFLEITKLKLNSYEFSTSIEDLLYNKGKFIRSLTLKVAKNTLITKNLITIGTHCRHLEEFNCNFKIDPEINQYTPNKESEVMFQKLVKFTCKATNPVLVQLCLTHALNIESVSISDQFWDIEQEETEDILTAELISKNPLTELNSLRIDYTETEYIISHGLLQHIFYTLPKLVKLDLLNMMYSAELQERLQRLSDEVMLNNLDLRFRYTFNYELIEVALNEFDW